MHISNKGPLPTGTGTSGVQRRTPEEPGLRLMGGRQAGWYWENGEENGT